MCVISVNLVLVDVSCLIQMYGTGSVVTFKGLWKPEMQRKGKLSQRAARVG